MSDLVFIVNLSFALINNHSKVSVHLLWPQKRYISCYISPGSHDEFHLSVGVVPVSFPTPTRSKKVVTSLNYSFTAALCEETFQLLYFDHIT